MSIQKITPQRHKAKTSPLSTSKTPTSHKFFTTSNIIQIQFSELINQSLISTGDPMSCKSCSSKLNFTSNLSLLSQQLHNWPCQFCGVQNQINLDQQQIPQQSPLIYILQKPHQIPQVSDSVQSQTIIFCLDISGSMGVTQPVKSPQKVVKNIKRSSVQYVSRLDCVKAAISQQISNLRLTSPQARVGIVTFNHQVRVIGDGTNQVRFSDQQLFSSYSLCQATLGVFSVLIGRPIFQTCDQLCAHLYSLEPEGPTALGPALLVSSILASQGGPGSKVIVCTDGIANVGLGACESNQEVETAASFYQQICEIAVQNKIEVSVVSIVREYCRLEALSKIVQVSGGDLMKVDPQDLLAGFSSILAKSVLATNLTVNVSLHRALSVLNQPLFSGPFLSKKLNSVSSDSFLTVEFTPLQGVGQQQIPVQITIEYTRTNGSKQIFIDTKLLEVTNSPSQVQAQADFSVISNHARLKISDLARRGKIHQSIQICNKFKNLFRSLNLNFHQKKVAEKSFKELDWISSQLLKKQTSKDQKELLSINLLRLSKKKPHFLN